MRKWVAEGFDAIITASLVVGTCTLLGVVLGYWGRVMKTSVPGYFLFDPVEYRKLYSGRRTSSSSSGSSRSSSRSSSWSSGSGHSSSGGSSRRSGGGGSFGGGGASGRW